MQVAAARAEGRELIDLTTSNPTRCGFAYDPALVDALASPDCLLYNADPLGALEAREAVAATYYGTRGYDVDAHNILLTASTSEAYGYLFRLLCNPGDEVLVPEPSYPLFDLLAQIQDVTLVRYPLRLHDDWRVDWPALRERLSPRTRAILIVHPNNPTGHTVQPDERIAFEAVAREAGLALIVDEVFLDYAVKPATPVPGFAGQASSVLTFVLSGLSKVLALPGMKLAWTVVCGPEQERTEALHRLGFIADTFLSVNAPVQTALRQWLPLADGMQRQIRTRVDSNLAALDHLLPGSVCSRLPVRAGWCAILRVPATLADEHLSILLLREAGVLVHPGSFYGLPARGWLVLSLLLQPQVFQDGVAQLIHAVNTIINRGSDV